MKIDVSTVYKQRIEQIEKDEKQAILAKKWSLVAKLRAEREKLEQILSENEG